MAEFIYFDQVKGDPHLIGPHSEATWIAIPVAPFVYRQAQYQQGIIRLYPVTASVGNDFNVGWKIVGTRESVAADFARARAATVKPFILSTDPAEMLKALYAKSAEENCGCGRGDPHTRSVEGFLRSSAAWRVELAHK